MSGLEEIPFLSLREVNAEYEAEILAAVRRVVESGWYILGRECEAFEAEFAEACGVRHAIGVGNGLDAITLVLEACKLQGRLKEGDGVIVPANSFIASALGVRQAGLRPVFCDPSEDTFNLDGSGVAAALDPGVRAVLPVHLYGRMADMVSIMEIARQRNLLVIEDAAQAHGARMAGRSAGGGGVAGAFSFYPGKNLGALGDGGCVVCDDDATADAVRQLRNYGSRSKYVNDVPGLNSRLDELQAAILCVKLKGMKKDAERRRSVAKRYCESIRNERVRLPQMPADADEHVWHLFVVRVENRESFVSHLEERGVGSSVHYPIPIHQQGAFRDCNDLTFPFSEAAAGEVVSLPLFPTLSEERQDRVIDAVNSWNG